MGEWTRDELVGAFDLYAEAVRTCVSSGDWEPFVQCFTPDATYVEHAYGNFAGHDAIRQWVGKTMGSFPGNEMVSFPTRWVSIDESLGWVICEIRNLMRDPGDGSVHEASNLTILRYAGAGKWREEEDVYNPMLFLKVVTGYVQRCQQLGTLSAEARAWAEHLNIDIELNR